MWHHNCSLWHHETVFMTSHPHSSWHHTHCIQHDIHSTCDITATVTMTRHLLYFDITLSECDISNGEWMTTQWLYLTWYPLHRCNQTHLIDDITPYVRMKKTHWMHDTIGTLHDITSTLADNTPLFEYHGTHSVYEIICIIYIVSHMVCMTTKVLYLAWNPLKLSSLPLCM